jgi:hypothetical protein
MRHDVDIDDFPPGTRVRTPTGRAGTVIKKVGQCSKLDHFLRVTIRLDGGGYKNTVTLQPSLLTKCPPKEGLAQEIEGRGPKTGEQP